jgi:hypothetical protein
MERTEAKKLSEEKAVGEMLLGGGRGGREGGGEREDGEGGGGGGEGRGARGGERACACACVRACTRRLACPLLPDVDGKRKMEKAILQHLLQHLIRRQAVNENGWRRRPRLGRR